jgi:diacylglycerol kinase family enzyme
VERLIYRVRGSNVVTELHEAISGVGLLGEARRIVEIAKEDKVASHVLIAVGGDGTVNLIARATMDADIPFGILPFGRENNIARSLYGTINPEQALDAFRNPAKQIDAIYVGDQLVLSAAGLGLLPSLHAYLLKKGAPRFGIGWGMVSNDLYKKQPSLSLTLKLDAHRLTVSTRMLSVHLLPYAAGLNLSPMSMGTDSHFEVILDQGKKTDRVANYVRDAAAKQIRFGSGLAAYRCEKVTIQSVKQQPLYLDGELVTVPSDVLDITRAPKQLLVVGAR